MEAYDAQNIFARILRNEIPCKKVFENDLVLAFHDIHPQARVHVLVIPKGAYRDMTDFSINATAEEKAALFAAVGEVARIAGVAEGGYRVIVNCGQNGGQEVPHLHLHIVGGNPLGRMVAPKDLITKN